MKCCICEREIEREPITGWDQGHNAEPVDDGRCCRECNDTVVVPTRIAIVMRRREVREGGE